MAGIRKFDELQSFFNKDGYGLRMLKNIQTQLVLLSLIRP